MNNKLLQGTMVLLSSSIVLKAIGFVYQMLVVRLAGTEALGILNMTMPFYMLLVVLATMGMPVAIAKLTAAYGPQWGHAALGGMLRTAFVCVGVLSCVCVLAAVFVMPHVFALLHTDARVRVCFWVLIPGILIVPICSVLRGYFQGLEQMGYPALGQIIEQIIRVAAGIGLLVWCASAEPVMLAVCLAAAAMLGELGGCLLLGWFYGRHRCQLRMESKSEHHHVPWLSSLLSLGVPVTATRITSTMDMAIEASMVPMCLLASGYTFRQAAAIYGQFSGVAVSLLLIPTVLTNALGTALVPAISGAASKGHTRAMEHYARQAISATWVVSLPIIFLLYLYGEELGNILFHMEGLGGMMRWLSLGGIFLYMGQTIVGILQGMGMTRTVCFNNFCGSAAKLMGMYYCITILDMGGNGIAGGMILGYGLQCLLNLAALAKQLTVRIPWGTALFPLVNSILLALQLSFWERMLPRGNWFVLLGMGLSVLGYLVVLLGAASIRRRKDSI